MQIYRTSLPILSALAGLALLSMPASYAEQSTPVRWDVAISSDSSLVGTCGDRIRIYDVQSTSLLREIEGPPTRCIAFSPVEPDLFAAAGEDRILRLWRVRENETFRELVGHTDEIRSVAFENSGRYVASTSSWGDYDDVNRGQLRLWEIESGTLVQSIEVTSGKVWGVSFSDDGSLIAFCRIDQGKACYAECYRVQPWQQMASIRISAGQELEENQWGKAVPTGYTTRFTPDDRQILVGGGICVRSNPFGYRYACSPAQVLWRVDLADSSSTRLFLDEERLSCFSIDVSPDGQQVVTGNGPIDMRRTSDGALLWSNSGGRGVAISPDGQFVAVGKRDSLLLLNAMTGESLHSIMESE